MRSVALVLALLLCGCVAASHEGRHHVFVIEVGAYQAFYGPDGRLERMHFDGDRDTQVEAVLLFSPDGSLKSAELDTDRDGTVDRWEHYGPGGVLARTVIAPPIR